MKNILLISLVILSFKSIAQSQKSVEKFKYCQIVFSKKIPAKTGSISTNLDQVDLNPILTPDGKKKQFSSVFPYLNYLGEKGWELIETHMVQLQLTQHHYYTLKKKTVVSQN